METAKVLTLLCFATIFLRVIKTDAQPPQRPLCVSQLALVNHACANLPYTPLPPPSPHSPSPPPHPHRSPPPHPHPPPPPHSPSPSPGPQPPSPTAPPPPPCSPDDYQCNGDRHGHEGHHGHGHENGHRFGLESRHGHRHEGGHHSETPVQENCCRWLKELDAECVCDLLVRLPPFLAKPAHEYIVIVDESCNVAYSCAGRIKP